jgi:hypothetical protein
MSYILEIPSEKELMALSITEVRDQLRFRNVEPSGNSKGPLQDQLRLALGWPSTNVPVEVSEVQSAIGKETNVEVDELTELERASAAMDLEVSRRLAEGRQTRIIALRKHMAEQQALLTRLDEEDRLATSAMSSTLPLVQPNVQQSLAAHQFVALPLASPSVGFIVHL